MYSEQIKGIKYQPKEGGRASLWRGAQLTRERLEQIITGFCTKDDINYAEQTKFLDLFDKYCEENGYPLIDRKTVGRILSKVFGVSSRVVRIDGEPKRIYVCKTNN